jgi:peptide/nickel transport system substrate-binding protein
LKKLRWQILVVFLALIAIGFLLLSQDQPLISGGEAVDQPVAGGTYSEALIGSPSRFNPLLDFYNQVDYDVDRLIYSSLVRFDDRGLPYGDLAETWGISKDGTKYSFSIRTNALWHDGTPVTSEDVVFTVGLLQNDEMPIPDDLRDFWKQVKVIALDDKTLQFSLPEAFSPFLDYLNIGILPRHLLSELDPSALIDSSFNLQPVGSGPYRFKGLDVQNDQITGIVLELNQDYFQKKPFIQEIHFLYFNDAQSALSAYQSGDVLGISYIPSEMVPEVLKLNDLRIFTGRLPKLNLIFLNLDDKNLPFFRDPEVRKALMMGINRRWIINRLLEGQAILANSPIFPESWAYYSGIPEVDFNPEKAIDLLKNAEYTFPAEGGSARAKEGVPIKFNLVYPDEPLYAAIAERVQQDWARLGVVASIEAVPAPELLSDYLETRSYEAALVELDFTRSPDPDPYPFWHQAQITSGQNYSQWDDRQVSEYLEQARVLDDFTERSRRYRNFQVRFATELPALPLYYPTYTYGIDESVYGVSMGPLFDPSDRFDNQYAWYLQTAPKAQLLTTPTP